MRVRAEDSDSDNEGDTQTTNYAREDGLSRLQEIDLGSIRADRIKADDRKQKYEDRANVKLLLESRDACKAGTEANALYNKNKSAIAAWNSKSHHPEQQFLLILVQIPIMSLTITKRTLIRCRMDNLIDSECEINMVVGLKSPMTSKLGTQLVAAEVLLLVVVEVAWRLLLHRELLLQLLSELLLQTLRVLALLLVQLNAHLDREFSSPTYEL